MNYKLSENNDTSHLKSLGRGRRKGKSIEKNIKENGNNKADYKRNSKRGGRTNTAPSEGEVGIQGIKRNE